MYDIAIIGAGVIGAMIARNLSKYQLNIVLIDKDTDVSNGTSKANSGIIHAGYNAKTGTLKAKLNVKGNHQYDSICRELDVPFKRIGSMVIAFDECDMDVLKELYERGIKNGVKELALLEPDRIKEMEPNISKDVIGALYAPECGIISPYELTIALCENAVENGVLLKLETQVLNIIHESEGFLIETNKGEIQSKCIVNAAGVFGDKINNLLNKPVVQITPRRGQYFVMDKAVGQMINHVIFQCPSDKGKGVVLVPTVHGNLLVGPDAEYVSNRQNVDTSLEGLGYIESTAKRSCPTLPSYKVITSYAGVRATPDSGDFIIEMSKESAGFINVIGIESPGLASAPAIADEVIDIIEDYLGELTDKEFYDFYRRRQIRFSELSIEERAKYINDNPLYANMICRCEKVTEAEVIDAIHRKVGATTVDGIKRRTRAGMGRCQGGFCSPKVMKILARELGVDPLEVEKDKKGSYILSSRTKD